MLKKVIQRYAVAFGMAAAMFAAGAGGIQKANAAEIADQAGSVQESETVRQSETPQESEMQRQPETTQQSETTGQSETLPLKNVKKAPKLSGKWVKQHGKVRFLLQDKTYATKTWANIKGRYYYFNKNGFRLPGAVPLSQWKNVLSWQKGSDGHRMAEDQKALVLFRQKRCHEESVLDQDKDRLCLCRCKRKASGKQLGQSKRQKVLYR